MSIPKYTKKVDLVTRKVTYTLRESFTYTSPRYGKDIQCDYGDESDGATMALDIRSKSWWVHDKICKEPFFTDGSPITVLMASRILSDILWDEGRWFRAGTWRVATLLGCEKARKTNGMW